MREINEAFRSENEDLAQYATAAVLSYLWLPKTPSDLRRAA
jgi:hypothetical protein